MRAGSIVAITYELAFAIHFHTVDAHINHTGPGLDPTALDHFRPAHSRNHQIRPAHHIGQVLCLGMGNRHRAAFSDQQLRHGLAHNIGTPDHHRFKPREIPQLVLGQHDAALGRAGNQTILACCKPARIHDMEPVHILIWVDGIDNLVGIDLGWQRQLHQNAMHGWILVELVYQRQQFSLQCRGRQAMLEAFHARFNRLLVLVAHIDLTGRIFPHQHHGQAGGELVGGL